MLLRIGEKFMEPALDVEEVDFFGVLASATPENVFLFPCLLTVISASLGLPCLSACMIFLA